MTLKSLTDKYRRDALTPEELSRLREMLADSDNDTVAAEIDNARPYRDGTIDARMNARLKQRIDSAIDSADEVVAGSHRILRIYKRIVAAAAVLIIGLAGLTVYFAAGRSAEASGLVAMSSTSTGKTDLTLPDGTEVILRGDSRLTFDSGFGKTDRKVTLEGQAYFNVSKSETMKFVVATPGLDVTVHGTVFSVISSADRPMAEVALMEGSISLKAGDSDLTMHPGETAMLDRVNGNLTLTETPTDVVYDWTNDQLTFNDTPPARLISELEAIYNVKLPKDIVEKIDQNFTGTLPCSNLGHTLDALRYIYGLPVSDSK